MMNNKKRKKNALVDMDDIRSDYCCSFIRPASPCEVDNSNENDQHGGGSNTMSSFVDGNVVRDFYEELCRQPGGSNEETKQSSSNNNTTLESSATCDDDDDDEIIINEK